jgi:soluble lytic murein transglycosylase-like protein
MKRAKVMKKYSHLFLFVVLLNATASAQNIQSGHQTAPAPRGLSRIGVAALQSLSKVAIVLTPISLTPMTADIAAPEAPLYSPVYMTTNEASPIKARNRRDAYAGSTITNASATAIAPAPISGRGVRNSVYRRLKGQTTGNARIDEIIVVAATRNGIEPLLLYSVMHQESAFNSQAVSPKGARGLMQLMPATAARFGVKNVFDPEQNIHGAAQYLRFLLDLFNGNVSLALAGYNAGEGAVKKYGYAIPPYRETINYVRKIKRRYTNLSTLSD